MKTVQHLFLFIYLVYFGACVEEALEPISTSPEPTVSAFPNVDRALWPYFESFEAAAEARGIYVDLRSTNIEGSIEDIDENNVAGSCSYGGRANLRSVVLDRSFWVQAPSLLREYIVFHELGHCYLFRDHLDACFADRTYVSLMRSGTGRTCRDNYNLNTREYYLDELFDAMRP